MPFTQSVCGLGGLPNPNDLKDLDLTDHIIRIKERNRNIWEKYAKITSVPHVLTAYALKPTLTNTQNAIWTQ